MSRVEQEITDLHDFFMGWFAGTVADTDEVYAAGFTSWCDAGFTIVDPGGVLRPFDELAQSLRGMHGTNPGFRIQVRDVRDVRDVREVREVRDVRDVRDVREVRDVTTQRSADNLVVATYQEWQRSTGGSTVVNNGRVSTAVFRRDEAARNGLVWLHVHETWLPADVVAAGLFDF